MVRPTINSEKHIFQVSLATVAGSASTNIALLRAVAAPSGSAEVSVGTVVKAVYCEMWVQASANQPTTQISTLMKLPSGLQNPVFGEMVDLFNYENKKNILYTTQGIVGDANSNPIPIVRQWIKIPKGKQRMGLGDKLIFTLAAQIPESMELCGMFIYKAYT